MSHYQISLAYLASYPPSIKIADVYDDDADLRSAIAATLDDFEYPDWSHRTVGEFYRYVLEVE